MGLLSKGSFLLANVHVMFPHYDISNAIEDLFVLKSKSSDILIVSLYILYELKCIADISFS